MEGGVMSDSGNEIDELKTLQREAAELKAERAKPRSTRRSAAGRKSETTEDRGVEAAPAEGPAGEEQVPEWEKAVRDLTTDLERTVNEIEEAARERPALALLAAFTIGIVVGQLFSRR
jgi:hypothetical protein